MNTFAPVLKNNVPITYIWKDNWAKNYKTFLTHLIKFIPKMKFKYFIEKISPNYREGSLIINGERVCDFLEDGVTGLGTGEYTLKIGKCPVQKRQIILVNPLAGTDCERCVNNDCAIRKLREKENDLLAKAVDELDGNVLKEYERTVHSDSLASLSQIHPPVCHRMIQGNGVNGKHDGRIIIGKRIAPGVVIDSKDTYYRFYKRIEKSIARGHVPVMEVVC